MLSKALSCPATPLRKAKRQTAHWSPLDFVWEISVFGFLHKKQNQPFPVHQLKGTSQLCPCKKSTEEETALILHARCGFHGGVTRLTFSSFPPSNLLVTPCTQRCAAASLRVCKRHVKDTIKHVCVCVYMLYLRCLKRWSCDQTSISKHSCGWHV